METLEEEDRKNESQQFSRVGPGSPKVPGNLGVAWANTTVECKEQETHGLPIIFHSLNKHLTSIRHWLT